MNPVKKIVQAKVDEKLRLQVAKEIRDEVNELAAMGNKGGDFKEKVAKARAEGHIPFMCLSYDQVDKYRLRNAGFLTAPVIYHNGGGVFSDLTKEGSAYVNLLEVDEVLNPKSKGRA